jgi:hypothetical protein
MASMRSRLSLVHPSAWKVNSPKFVFTESSEVPTREHRSAFARRRDDACSSPIW